MCKLEASSAQRVLGIARKEFIMELYLGEGLPSSKTLL